MGGPHMPGMPPHGVKLALPAPRGSPGVAPGRGCGGTAAAAQLQLVLIISFINNKLKGAGAPRPAPIARPPVSGLIRGRLSRPSARPRPPPRHHGTGTMLGAWPGICMRTAVAGA
jgi:hypothetical protein